MFYMIFQILTLSSCCDCNLKKKQLRAKQPSFALNVDVEIQYGKICYCQFGPNFSNVNKFVNTLTFEIALLLV